MTTHWSGYHLRRISGTTNAAGTGIGIGTGTGTGATARPSALWAATLMWTQVGCHRTQDRGSTKKQKVRKEEAEGQK